MPLLESTVGTQPGVGEPDVSQLPRPLRALDWSRRRIGQREHGGKNCGGIVDEAVEKFTSREACEGESPAWAQWCAGHAWRAELESGQQLGHHDQHEYLSCNKSWARLDELPGYVKFHNVDEAQPGDLIWFGEGKAHHMGRVDHVDLAAGVLYTVEGNAGPHADAVALVKRKLDAEHRRRIFGLARPPA